MNKQHNLNVIYQNILNSEQVKYLNAKFKTYIYMYNDIKHGQAPFNGTIRKPDVFIASLFWES